jgi:transcriptional regulator with XRE-family HTH domain
VNAPGLRRQLQSLAANLRKRRLSLGLTQEALGECASMSSRYVQDVESGRKNITIKTLVALAAALRVQPLELLKNARLPPTRRGRPVRSGKLDSASTL